MEAGENLYYLAITNAVAVIIIIYCGSIGMPLR